MKPDEFSIATPSDLDNEAIVLCGMLRDNETLIALIDRLAASDFSPSGADVFKAIMAVWEVSREKIDPEFVLRELVRQTGVPEDKWRQALLNILESDPSASAAIGRAEMVLDRSLRKQMVNVSQQTIADCSSPREGAEETLSRAQREMMKIGADKSHAATYSFKQIAREVGELIDAKKDAKDGVMRSGLIDFDAKTGGFHAGELVIIAARPGAGKSALMLNIATYAAANGIPGLLVSLEMSRSELMMRYICGQSGVKSQFVRGMKLNKDEAALLVEATHNASALPLWVNDCDRMKTRHIGAVARRCKAAHGIGFVMVDYMQLIEPEDRRQNRVEQVGEFSRSLKMLARGLSVPVICAAQLNREVEKRKDGKPILSDLRESGSIEQDADTVIFLHKMATEAPQPVDSISVIIAKQRNGPTGEVCLSFRKDKMTFENAGIPR
jgi:replicative DNA helicase